jgi:hypothetical protein
MTTRFIRCCVAELMAPPVDPAGRPPPGRSAAPAGIQVGRAFGLTRERIRQLEQATLKKLAALPETGALRWP